eukprot:CAMPEP_0170546556 /NCGR_PEP_ID=MMETSP0211-20121228/4910_1 /TAXON_ID=311385 /ORGANISM="Pseudokeronopsis sp., Strain OXSARD2" /LENGTH=335 /DNA_ID=CAMNT_0010851085 /DNA_START=168 /DNA_END=1175 /DNA_ORIENTATION=-
MRAVVFVFNATQVILIAVARPIHSLIDIYFFPRDPCLKERLVQVLQLGRFQHVLLVRWGLLDQGGASSIDGRELVVLVVTVVLAQALDPWQPDLVPTHTILVGPIFHEQFISLDDVGDIIVVALRRSADVGAVGVLVSGFVVVAVVDDGVPNGGVPVDEGHPGHVLGALVVVLVPPKDQILLSFLQPNRPYRLVPIPSNVDVGDVLLGGGVALLDGVIGQDRLPIVLIVLCLIVLLGLPHLPRPLNYATGVRSHLLDAVLLVLLSVIGHAAALPQRRGTARLIDLELVFLVLPSPDHSPLAPFFQVHLLFVAVGFIVLASHIGGVGEGFHLAGGD